MAAPLAYVDSSALVKLIHTEPESAALRAALISWPTLVSSELLFIETMRVAARLNPPQLPLAQQVLSTVRLIPIRQPVPAYAAGIGPPQLRTLDAIHLATAELLRAGIGAFFAYDTRLVTAAINRRLPTASPV